MSRAHESGAGANYKRGHGNLAPYVDSIQALGMRLRADLSPLAVWLMLCQKQTCAGHGTGTRNAEGQRSCVWCHTALSIKTGGSGDWRCGEGLEAGAP